MLLCREVLILQLINANDVYAKFGRTGTANLHIGDIDTIPRVDAVEVVHAHWEDMWGGKYANPRYVCSACKEKSLYRDERDVLGNWHQVQALTVFCPHCGAQMDEKEKADG